LEFGVKHEGGVGPAATLKVYKSDRDALLADIRERVKRDEPAVESR
jgi:hypothetical protein